MTRIYRGLAFRLEMPIRGRVKQAVSPLFQRINDNNRKHSLAVFLISAHLPLPFEKPVGAFSRVHVWKAAGTMNAQFPGRNDQGSSTSQWRASFPAMSVRRIGALGIPWSLAV